MAVTRIARAELRIQRANHELDRYDTLLRRWQETHRPANEGDHQ